MESSKFLTKAERLYRCAERCTMQPDQGRCETYQEMYFYNATAGECQKFAYGGCDGNPNRFSTGEECEAECSRSRVPHTCTLPQEIGPCKARKPAWSYDEKTGKCNLFFYGGCQGNQNNFRSMDECNRVCESYRSNKPVTSGTSSGDTAQEILGSRRCQLPPEEGPCRGTYRRFHFDPEAKTCREFKYGGCRGNENNYHSVEECMGHCTEGLSSPPDTSSLLLRDAPSQSLVADHEQLNPGITLHAFFLHHPCTLINI
ncbi:unnamed protein product [Darwinula stevensoni]|uniref:BPTI/Kunitz inhibitor domain-containing protein n=1 Tax=Darwinula stevensoni TaxID=69355 RepID=A0A7R8X296_9CRUS|nr:unnamed protein product [Darwinula stevensoni]CAG0880945.1 unnamed protein product [Darwinula stevensoni]